MSSRTRIFILDMEDTRQGALQGSVIESAVFIIYINNVNYNTVAYRAAIGIVMQLKTDCG